MAPIDLLPFALQGDALIPTFLTAADDPWLSLLLDEYARFHGETRRRLEEHLRSRLPFDAPAAKLRLVRDVLNRLYRTRVVAAVPPRRARRHAFRAAAGRPAAREAVLDQVAEALGVTAGELEQSLLADLPGERRVVPPETPLTPADVRARSNLRLVQALLERSSEVRLRLEGNARPVVRQAKLRGLICTALTDEATQSVRLEISGPLALFKRTLVYGRALAELIPQLTWCHRFYLDANIELPTGTHRLIVASGAPIFPGKEPKRFDSRLEERFARDFARATGDWDIIREPEPVPVGNALVFPDFALVRRKPPFERWLVEIVGFWTPDYLKRKLAVLRLAGLKRLILCIDAARACGEEELPEGAQVIRFHRKIDQRHVLAIIDTPRAKDRAA